MRKKLNEIAKEKAELNQPLLSNYSGSFWQEYLSNFEIYDTYFTRKFEKFVYWRETETPTTDFVMDCKTWLTIHNKDLSELYRIHVIDDEDYSLTNNYDMTEIMDKSASEGARIDTTNKQFGNKSRTQNDSIGARNEVNVEQVSPYDSEGWHNQNKSTSDNSAATDITTITDNAYTDIDTYNKGLQQDSEHYSLTRKGNIGVMTATDMLRLHKDFWTTFDFYSYIFDNMAKEFLMAKDPDSLEAWLC